MPQQSHPVTIRELAIYILEKEGYEYNPESLTGTDFYNARLSIFGGCIICGASLGAYNASPSKSGYWKCTDGCIDEDGWYDVEECYNDIMKYDDDVLI